MYMVTLCTLFVHIIGYIQLLILLRDEQRIEWAANRNAVCVFSTEKRRIIGVFLCFCSLILLRYTFDKICSAFSFNRIYGQIFVIRNNFPVFAENG